MSLLLDEATRSMPRKKSPDPEAARKAARQAYLERNKVIRVVIDRADLPYYEDTIGRPLDGPRLSAWVRQKVSEENPNVDRDQTNPG